MAIGNGIGVRWGRVSLSSASSPDFIMEVDTRIVGATPDNQFVVATQGAEVFQGNDFNVKTSDGQEFNNITANSLTITFPSPGIYTIKISGKFSGTRYGISNDGKKIIDIKNWGDWEALQWARARDSFRECDNLTTFSASDAPYLGGLDSQGLNTMFWNCDNLNADFSKWDVGSIENFDSMFGYCGVFNNSSLNNWDMSSATRISYMFQEANAFNQDLSAWDVSNVTDMRGVFDNADAFNGDVSTWNTSSLTGSLFRLFSRTSFNGDLSNWDVSGVTSLDNTFAFSPFNNDSISNWDVSNVSDWRSTFAGATAFNQDISGWDTSGATKFDSTFSNANAFNQPIGSWDVSNVTRMDFMFYSADSFNQDISGWDVSGVTMMQGMFQDRGNASTSNLNISNWTTTSLTNTYQMFRGSGGNTTDLSNWDMSNITDARGMFEFGGMTFDPSRWNIQGVVNLRGIFNQSQNTSGVVGLWTFNNWNISQATDITAMLGTNVITTAAYDATLIAWAAQAPANALTFNVNSTQYTLGGEAEAARTALINTYGWTITDGGGIAVPMIITVDTTLGDGLDNYTLNFTGTGYDIETSDGQTITGATTATTINFPGPGTYDIEISGDVSTRSFASDLKLIDIKKWGVLDTPLDDKFSGANSLTTITAPDQPVISSMTRLFNNAQNFAGGISHWDVSNIESFQRAFYSTSFNEDISSWDMSSANTLQEMFWFTPFNNGGQPGIGNWDVSNVTNFYRCFAVTPFNQPIGSWNIKTSGSVRMDYMFSQATAFNQDLNAWDVSGVTTMTRMFNVASSFNGDVSNWDVSGVADLGYMFERASSFNHPGIGSWNTSGATSMAGMFDGVNLGMAFNQDISGWDVSNVLQMNNMFRNCYSLDQPFNSWNTSSLQNMSQVFFNCISFNQPLNLWNTSNVTQMQNVFYGASSFNQPLGDWDTSNVINMIGTFRGASSFNQALNLWNTSVVGNMTSMFYGATSFNQDLSTWNTSNVTSLSNAFELTTASSFGIANWNTSNVNNFNATFRNNTSFNEDVSGWDITGCTGSFNDTFSGCQSFNQPIGNWNITSAVTRLSNLLRGAISFDQDLSSWNISGVTLFNSFAQGVTLSTANYDALLVAWESQAPVFSGAISFGNSQYTLGGEAEAAKTSLINTYGWTITDGGGVAEVPFQYTFLPFGGANTHTITTDPAFTYNYNVSVSTGETFTNQTGNLNITFPDKTTLRTMTITGVFPALQAATNGTQTGVREIISFGSNLWRKMDRMFKGMSGLTGMPSTGPNLQLCTSFYETFHSANIPVNNYIGSWNVSNVTSMDGAFRSCNITNADITNWDVSNVTVFLRMFAVGSGFATTLTDLTGWNTGKGTNFQEMFSYQLDFNQDISGWDMSSATNLQSMFFYVNGNLIFNQPIGSWNTSSLTNINGTLRGCGSFDQDLSNWNISNLVSQTTSFLEFGGLSRANYDATLIGWATNPSSNININFGTSQYTLGGAAEAARNTLINTYNWTITDGGGTTAAFTITVDTTLGDGLSEYEIRTRSDIQTYNYDITTSDGQSITGVTGNYNVTFSSPGTYDIEIRGTFPWLWGFGAPDRLKIIGVKEWGAQAWSSWEYMFYQCGNLSAITATDSPNLSSVTNMNQSFQQTSIGSPDFSSWDVSNVTSMASLFRSSNFNGNVSTWDVSNVTNMGGTFGSSPFNSDITSWNVGNVTSFNECFFSAVNFNQDISGWDTSSATSFRWMFYNAYQFNADISSWNTSSLTNMDLTFRQAIMFDQNISGWDINSVTVFNNLFLSTVGPSQDNYDAILIGWEAQAPLTGKSIDFGEATYTPGGAAEAARTSLINTYGWTITDGGSRTAQTSGFLLDDYPGAAAAYSFRQLSSSTPIVAQLSTSNVSTDFRDFTATEMQRRLHQFLGYRSLRTFYDQSGNGRNANNGNMLIENGAPGLVDGYPVARTNSGFGTMFTPQQALSIDNSSIFFVGKITAAGHLFNYSSTTAPVGGGRLLYADQNLVSFSSASNGFSSNFTMNTTGLSLSYGVQNGQNVDLYHDAQTASGSMPSGVATATNQYFGLTNVYPTTSGGPFNSAEFVFYPDDKSADIIGIRNNINEFYQL